MRKDESRPNIVLVFMDDMGYGDMGCFGSDIIRTPNMDRVASEGIRFTQMYAASSVCSPSRTGLLTGRQPQRVGIERVLFPQDTRGIPDSERTVADDLRDLGYRTAMAGKWHMGCRPEQNPVRHGFDSYFGLLYSNDMNPLELYRDETVIESAVDQALLTRRYTDEIIRFIEESKGQPFFTYLAHTMPHIPLHVEPDFRGISDAGTYGDTIECIDYHLGRILERLDKMGLSDNTIVMVTSDNGPWYEGSTGGLRGRKFDLYEGGIRMPFVARWPRVVEPGSVCNEVASLLDIRSTLTRCGGGDAPEGVDGVDLTPALQGDHLPERDGLYWYQGWNPNAMRMGRWKLHVGARGDLRAAEEMPHLFDMETDPTESYSVSEKHPEIVQKMLAMMEAFDRPIQMIKAEIERKESEDKGV